MNIYITRPGQAGADLVYQLQHAGYAAIHLPLFAIKPILNSTTLRQQLAKLPSNAIIIVLSSVVVSVLQCHLSAAHFAPNWQYFAVGQKTASLLQQYLQQPVHFPLSENSEGLLQQLALQPLQQQSVLILRGTTGRDYLPLQLDKRNARVQCIPCYARTPIYYAPDRGCRILNGSIMTATSNECIYYLNQLIAYSKRSQIRLIVTSMRIKKAAEKANWTHSILIQSASNQILFKTICALCHNNPLNMQQDENIHDREKKTNCP